MVNVSLYNGKSSGSGRVTMKLEADLFITSRNKFVHEPKLKSNRYELALLTQGIFSSQAYRMMWKGHNSIYCWQAIFLLLDSARNYHAYNQCRKTNAHRFAST